MELLENNEVTIIIRTRRIVEAKPLTFRCPKCKRDLGPYDNEKSRERGVRSHQQHCTGNRDQYGDDVPPQEWIAGMNGASKPHTSER